MKFSVVFFIILSFLISCNTAKNIVDSNDIKEIEAYLKTSHPEDPKNQVLKSKLIALKNADWVKGAKDAKPMAARPISIEIPKVNAKKNSSSQEAQEFNTLIALTPEAHRERTTKLLNKMLNTDISNNEVILLLQNKSDCNMILRLQGKNYYNLAVPAHGENSIVLPIDTYVLTSNICDVKYSSTKKLVQNLAIILGNPSDNFAEKPNETRLNQSKKIAIKTNTNKNNNSKSNSSKRKKI